LPGKSADIGVNANLELVDRFCYLGDMLSVDGDADAAVKTRIQIGWNKFRQLVPVSLLTSDVTIFESKSKIAILAQNRIGSKLRFPCITETILSVVAVARFTLRAVMRYRSHQCSAGARTCLSSADRR